MSILNTCNRRLFFIAILGIFIQLFINKNLNAGIKDGEGYVINDGVKIWYKVEGSQNSNSIPILLIHGGPGATARPFEKSIGPEIAKNRIVIYMDLRGTGRSDRPSDPSKYSYSILAGDADAIRMHLGIEKWVVFGHSNGGATAITYTLQHSRNTAGLILCDPLLSYNDLAMNMVYKVALAPEGKYLEVRTAFKADVSDEIRFGNLLDLLDQKTRDSFQFYNVENSTLLNKYQGELSKEINKGLMEPALMKGLINSGFFTFDAYKSSAGLTMPVLIILGRYDSEISLDNSMKFALTIPDGYIAMLNHSGHHPYLEETKECSIQIESFIQKRVIREN